jgi:exopolyphosphatase/pppGpp-phosphohydrolase
MVVWLVQMETDAENRGLAMSDAPIAALDVGSNTIHLVVARVEGDGHSLDILADELDLTRLGADISASGRIGQERATRAIAVLREQVERARALGAQTLLGVATEGVRAAANRDGFLARVRDEAGIALHTVTGDQEAALTYWGATSTLPSSRERRAVLDLGGGSLEMVVGEGARVVWRVTVPLGSGTLHDRYTPSDPPTAEEVARAGEAAAETLQDLTPPLPVTNVTACGGTATTLVRLAARALASPSSSLSGPTSTMLSSEQLEELLRLLQSHPAAEIARYGIQEARARLLAAGGVVLLNALRRLGKDALRVSERGIREGAILAYVHAGDGWLEEATTGQGWS